MPKPTPADPLADLREPAAPAGITTTPVIDAVPDEPLEVLTDQPLDALWHQDATARIITRWHSDPTATANLHHGGTCPCRYIATLALLEAVGQPVDPEPDETPED